MWFGNWSQLAHTIGAALVAYVALVVVLRVAGKRTLAKLNAFDLVVTVALGSALATVILAPDVSVADGIVALSALVATRSPRRDMRRTRSTRGVRPRAEPEVAACSAVGVTMAASVDLFG